MVVQSIAWAYESGSEPAHESTPFDVHASEPRATTVAGVQALEVAALEVVQPIVLRYGVFYGPGTWYAPGGPIPDRIRTGVLAANDAVTSFLHVHDAAWAALQALSWPIGTYNIVDDEPARACDWVPRLARVLNVPAPAPTAGREPWERGASNQRAREVGWRARYGSWRNGFAAMTMAIDAASEFNIPRFIEPSTSRTILL